MTANGAADQYKVTDAVGATEGTAAQRMARKNSRIQAILDEGDGYKPYQPKTYELGLG